MQCEEDSVLTCLLCVLCRGGLL